MENKENTSNSSNPSDDSKIKMKRSPHTEDMVDHYWGSINYIFGLIKASEIKAGLLLSFYGIVFNFMFQRIVTIVEIVPDNTILYVLLGLWFCCTAISIFFCIQCFIPHIEEKYDKNIFFFGDVISKFGTIKEFSKTFYKISLNEEEVFDHMGQQIYIISKITANKFKNVKRALQFLAVGMFILLVTIVYITIILFM